MPATRAVSTQAKLKYVLVTFLGVDDSTYVDNPITKALFRDGINGYDDLLAASEKDIEGLMVPGASDTDPPSPLSSAYKRKLHCAIAFHHHASRVAKGAINVMTSTKAQYDIFRTSLYDSSKSVVPWNVGLSASTNADLILWKKTVRPSKSDFKEFRDERNWSRSKEHILTTLESMGLQHLVDSTFVITDPDLDDAQMKWFYSILLNIMISPLARTIVLKHKTTMNTRDIWKDLQDAFDNSMASELRCQTLSTYLTSTRYVTANWRGTLQNWLLHYKEQVRLHTELSPAAFSQDQLVNFLNAALTGCKPLDQILVLNKTARAAAGNTTKITFEEYLELLLQQAQIEDAARFSQTNPRSRRSSNVHDMHDLGLEFDDDESCDLEVHVHDVYTPVEELTVMQMDRSNRSKTQSNYRGTNQMNRGNGNEPRKVRLDYATWKGLTDTEKKAWDVISESGKSAILAYAANNPDRYKNPQKPHYPLKTGQRVQFHDLIFDPDPPEPDPVEAHVHEAVDKTKSVPEPDLLDMATSKTTASTNPGAAMSINKVLSQKPKLKSALRNANSHEIQRSEYTPEVNVHEIHFLGGTIQLDDDDVLSIPDDDDTQGNVEHEASQVTTPTGHQLDSTSALLDFSNLQIEDDPPDITSPEAFTLEASSDVDTSVAEGTADDYYETGYYQDREPVDILSPQAFTREDDDGDIEEDLIKFDEDAPPKPQLTPFWASPPKSPPTSPKSDEYMSGKFSQVKKPVKMMDRIVALPDGSGHAYIPLPPLAKTEDVPDTQSEDIEVVLASEQEEIQDWNPEDVSKGALTEDHFHAIIDSLNMDVEATITAIQTGVYDDAFHVGNAEKAFQQAQRISDALTEAVKITPPSKIDPTKPMDENTRKLIRRLRHARKRYRKLLKLLDKQEAILEESDPNNSYAALSDTTSDESVPSKQDFRNADH